MNSQGWIKIPLRFLCFSRLVVFVPCIFFSSLLFGFGLSFLLVVPGSVIFFAVDVQLENIFFLLCFFQAMCTALFFFSLLRLRQKLRLCGVSEEEKT